MNNYASVKKYLSEANKYDYEKIEVPYFQLSFLLITFHLNIRQLEEALMNGDGFKKHKIQNDTLKIIRKTLRTARKVASDRTEAFKLMGTYLWLIGNQKKALLWWSRSIKTGERIGARLELSRTYFEVGKRLLGPESKHKMLNGIKAEE